MSWLHDKRSNSWSYICELTIQDYLRLANAAHKERGGIDGQRDPLTTATGKRIRTRMLKDLQEGALLPPLVIGVVLPKEVLDEVVKLPKFDLIQNIPEKALNKLAIIDGMQRTTALEEAVKASPKIGENKLRVEVWLSQDVNSLVYRMLILNTGQVPWTMARQLTVIYSALLSEIKEHVTAIEAIMTPDDNTRRKNGAEYTSEALIELYLNYSSRKLKTDIKQAVSEQFARLDFVENLDNSNFQQSFYTVLGLMAQLDIQLSRIKTTTSDRFSTGKKLFGAHPARVGFVVSAGQMIVGRSGNTRTKDEQTEKLNEFEKRISNIISNLKEMDEAQLCDFFCFDILEQILSVKSGKVGEFEREVFCAAFKVLIEEHTDLKNMESCWRAYY